jgi:hypothetical protein
MKCEIHPNQDLIPAIIKPIKTCIVYPDKRVKNWEYVCPRCWQFHIDLCQKEFGHKFPSE